MQVSPSTIRLLTPDDTSNAARGRDSGVKVAIETWTNITPALWLQLDASRTDAHKNYSVLSRLGYRVTPNISAGVEADALGNASGDLFRAGLFAKYEWSAGEIVLAGGLSDQNDRSKLQENAWAAVNFLYRY